MILRAIAIVAALAAPVQLSAATTCVLQPISAKWQGSCGKLIEGEMTSLTIGGATSITTGVWRKDAKPTAIWSGTIIAGDYPATPAEIELYADGRGALRTEFGWFPLSGLVRSKEALRFDVDSSREVQPSGVDREIIQRADAILSSDQAWNRADDRKCPAEATSWSIYCAMEKATMEVSGAFHHRRPALQVVRAIVDERTANRPYQHRLMDYNNDPTTHLSDVRSLFAEALKRIDAMAQSQRR